MKRISKLLSTILVFMVFFSFASTKTYADLRAGKQIVSFEGLNDKETFVYDGTSKQPSGEISVVDNKIPVEDLEILYESTDSGGYSDTNPPINAGNYSVTYKVPDTYPGFEGQIVYDFTIEKAEPIFDEPLGLEGIVGEKLVTIKLPEQFEWWDDTYTLYPLGYEKFNATYVPKDTINYKNIDLEIIVYIYDPEAEYAVTLVFTPGGKATASSSYSGPSKDIMAKIGEKITLEVEVEKGFVFDRWDGLAGGVVIDNNTFIMPNKDVLLQAEFYKLPDATYQILSGADSIFDKATEEEITIVIDADFNQFLGIELDGETVPPSAYEVKEGSTIITFKPEFLDTLDEGIHEIEIIFEDKEVATTLTITNKKEPIEPDEKDPITPEEKDPVEPAEKDPVEPAEKESDKPIEKEEELPPAGMNYSLVLYSLGLIISIVGIKVLKRKES